MNKQVFATKAAQRAIAGLMSVALVTSGAVVATAPAYAQAGDCAPEVKLRPENGDGTLSVEPVNFQKVVTIKGSGFAARPTDGGFLGVKLNQNALDWPADQSAGDGLKYNDNAATTLELPAASIVNGEFTVRLVLPDNLKDGQYLITFLGGNDGGPVVSKRILVHVNNTGISGNCGTYATAPAEPTTPPPAPTTTPPAPTTTPAPDNPSQGAKAELRSATINAVSGRGGAKGTTVINVGVSNFPVGSTVGATINGVEIPRSGTGTPAVVPEGGKQNVGFVAPAGVIREGNHVLKVTANGDNPIDVPFQVNATGQVSNSAAQGATVAFNAAGLPDGAKVTRVGTKDVNWLSDGQAATADDKGLVLIENIKIPADAPFGAPVTFAYELNGNTVERETTNKVNASNNAIGVDGYDAANIELPSGLYQSAVNDSTGHVFVSRGVRTSASGIYKLDAKTLEVVAKNESLHPESDSAVYAAYGIGLDNKRGLVWVTNTRQNTVSVYKQDDLSHVKTFPKGSTGHSRDVLVDETTGLAYVSSAGNQPNNVVDIYDATKDEKVGSIVLDGFDRVMSLAFDKESRTIYTTSLNTPKAAAISLGNNNAVKYYDLPADQVDRPSGIAYDPTTKQIFVASQGTGNLVVINAETGAFVKSIPTGASALNAAYNPVDKRVYVTNRGGGTITVVDAAKLEVVANLPAGTFANHVSIGADGAVYAVNKAARSEDANNPDAPRWDGVYRYFPKTTAGGGNGNDDGSKDDSSNKDGSNKDGSGENKGILAILGVVGIVGLIAGIVAALVRFGIIPAHLVPAQFRM